MVNLPKNKLSFLLLTGCFLTGSLLAAESPKKPDVVVILFEDLSARFGVYGNKEVKTPNIDALAKEGVTFVNAQCAYPVCNPARTAFLSGLRPGTTQALNNGDDPNKTMKTGTTMPEIFQSGGYRTIGLGKTFHTDGKFDSTWRWSENPEMEGNKKPRDVKQFHTLFDNGVREKLLKEDQKKYSNEKWGWGPLTNSDDETSDGRIALTAAKILQEKNEQPLFLMVGFHSAHTNWHAPQKYYDMYDPEKLTLPDSRYPKDDLDDVPRGRYDAKPYPPDVFPEKARRAAIHALYAQLTFADTNVGIVLDALKKSGRKDNTIVVLVSDHGLHTGEHFLWQKKTFFDEASRIPMIISAPGVTPQGVVCERPVESVDIFPTLLEYCKIEGPKNLEGFSMVPLLKTPDRPWKKAAFTYMRLSSGKNRDLAASIRTERYRYSEWGSPEEAELYDCEKDPYQITNVVKDPAYADTVKQLSALLKGGWGNAVPQW